MLKEILWQIGEAVVVVVIIGIIILFATTNLGPMALTEMQKIIGLGG